VTVILSAGSSASAPPLRLRPWHADDAAELARAFRDPVLRRFLRTSIDNEADARQWIETRTREWAAGTRFSFAVLETAAAGDTEVSGPVGYVAVKGMANGNRAAEVGYWTSAAARGRGIAPRALDAVSVWALQSQPLDRLELIHASDNPASCRVAHKCGFVHHCDLPAEPPDFPVPGHLHVRDAG
jgi:RimJ/RimL family protein N-acetyltransferase